MFAYIYVSVLLYVSQVMFPCPTMMAATIPVDHDPCNDNEPNMIPNAPSPLNLTLTTGQSQSCISRLASGDADQTAREKTCSIDTSSEDITKLALCPWANTINRDVNRVPRDIKVAKCLCGKCAGMSNFLKECRPIYKDIQVFRLNATTGLFQSELEQVPVACGCGIYSEEM